MCGCQVFPESGFFENDSGFFYTLLKLWSLWLNCLIIITIFCEPVTAIEHLELTTPVKILDPKSSFGKQNKYEFY